MKSAGPRPLDPVADAADDKSAVGAVMPVLFTLEIAMSLLPFIRAPSARLRGTCCRLFFAAHTYAQRAEGHARLLHALADPALIRAQHCFSMHRLGHRMNLDAT